jgi:5'-nucleotidase
MGKSKGRMKRRPLILVSNDDGIMAKGLTVLAGSLAALGRVVVVAPDQQRSAASRSITLHRPLRITKVGRDRYYTDGTPTDCVILAVHEILKEKPDIIVSGINHGPNLGDDVHYSGTVSVACEGGIIGIPSIAVSLVMASGRHFDTAGRFAKRLAALVLKKGLPHGTVLNVNVPDLPETKIPGYKFTKHGKRNYGSDIIEKEDPRKKKYYWIGGDQNAYADIEDSDCNAIRENYISITPLCVDITDVGALKAISGWRL